MTWVTSHVSFYVTVWFYSAISHTNFFKLTVTKLYAPILFKNMNMLFL